MKNMNDDLISRRDAKSKKVYSHERHEYVVPVAELDWLPSAQPERMTNRQWVDFLSAQFDISRTSAKEMLHGMMRWKKEDNFKKMFNGGKT